MNGKHWSCLLTGVAIGAGGYWLYQRMQQQGG